MTIQEQRRKAFEVWFEGERHAAWRSFYRAFPELAESDPSPEFGAGNKEGFWTVWNAALDSVEVEFPRQSAVEDLMFISDARKIIESAGMRVKG